MAFVKPKKIIYAEDEIYAGKTENGYYLFHTTLDPAEKFKQRRIGLLDGPPDKKFVLERIKYGQNGEKVKWHLDKEQLREWIEDEYGYIFCKDPSPWAPKKLGSSSIGNKRPAPSSGDSSSSETDEDDGHESSAKKQRKLTMDDLFKKLEDIFILVTEIANNQRIGSAPVPE